MKDKRSIIAFMNAYSEGKSGADKAFIKIFKRIKHIDLTVVTSQLGQELCKKERLKAHYYITSREKKFDNAVIIYIKRIIAAVKLVLTLPSFDIIYSTSDSLPDIIPALIYKFKKKKRRWITKIFHLIPKKRWVSSYAQKISLFFIKKLADMTIVTNKQLLNKLVLMGFPEKKLKLNYLGVDNKYYNKIPPSNKIHEAIFMARLHESKGILDLPIIWNTIVDKMPAAKLAIIGYGDEFMREKLKQTIQAYGLEKNIDILGYLEDDIAFGLIKSSKVFIFPSREEGFGMIIGEVMACKVPIIAYDLPVYQDTFKYGIVSIPIGNTDRFSQVVFQLLHREHERKAISKKAFKISQRFSWDLTSKKELKLFS